MPQHPRPKSWFYWLSILAKNSTAYKSPRLCLMPAMADDSSKSVVFTPHSTHWKRKVFSNPDGVTIFLTIEAAQDDVTTNSRVKELQHLIPSWSSEIDCSSGNHHFKFSVKVSELPSKGDFADALKAQNETESDLLDAVEQQLDNLDRAAKLRQRSWQYEPPDIAKMPAVYLFAAPISRFFSKERREEWMGDLLETIEQDLQNGYYKWFINLLTVGRTFQLVLSSVQIYWIDKLNMFFQKIQ
jgi:hypothetical protein